MSTKSRFCSCLVSKDHPAEELSPMKRRRRERTLKKQLFFAVAVFLHSHVEFADFFKKNIGRSFLGNLPFFSALVGGGGGGGGGGE